jgi:hypothetical protein
MSATEASGAPTRKPLLAALHSLASWRLRSLPWSPFVTRSRLAGRPRLAGPHCDHGQNSSGQTEAGVHNGSGRPRWSPPVGHERRAELIERSMIRARALRGEYLSELFSKACLRHGTNRRRQNHSIA